MKNSDVLLFQAQMENLMQAMHLLEMTFCFISGALIILIIPGTMQLPLLRKDSKKHNI
jgi:hypothetical protein